MQAGTKRKLPQLSTKPPEVRADEVSALYADTFDTMTSTLKALGFYERLTNGEMLNEEEWGVVETAFNRAIMIKDYNS